MKKVSQYLLAFIAVVSSLATAAHARAASSTAETIAWALDTAQPIYNAGVSGGSSAATSMLPIYIGAAVILVILGIAAYVAYRMTHWGSSVIRR